MRLATVIGLGTAVFAAVGGPSSAEVTAVSGSAFGVRGNVQLFGGDPIVLAPTPTVTLPPTGAAQNASVPSIVFAAGPADLLTAGATDVATQGTLGAGGSVTSTATVRDVVIGGTTITSLSSTCTASETGVSGSTTVSGGRVPTGDPNRQTEGDETYTDIPANPTVGATFNGVVPSVSTDYYRVVFNEQIVIGNTITVNAAHFFLGEPAAGQDPVATGEVIVGQVVCGVTATATTTTVPIGGTTTTVATGGTTTTVATGGTTTTVATGGTTTTVATGGTTTTVVGGTTTTTRPAGTTTTTRAGGATTTSTAPPAVVTTPPPPGRPHLVRTGSSFQALVVLSLLAIVMGALALLGFGNHLATAGPGAGSGPWAALVRHAAERRRRRRPWNRRRWS